MTDGIVIRGWTTEGTERIDPGMLVDRLPDFDPRSADHLWMVSTGFRVVPEQWQNRDHTPRLDHENLLTITVPFCWFCEEAYAPRLARRRCPGHPVEA